MMTMLRQITMWPTLIGTEAADNVLHVNGSRIQTLINRHKTGGI